MSDADKSREVDEVVQRLEANERARKTRLLIRTALVLIPAIIAIAFAWMYREAILAPNLDVEGGEKEVLAETDDPQCRTLIADVTAIGEDFAEFQPTVSDQILSKDRDALENIRLRLADFRRRLDGVESRAPEANLRFDSNREELNAWFESIDQELEFLDQLAQDQMAVIDAEAAGDEPPEPRYPTPFVERRDGAIVAADDNFQNFRVWHTSSLHPCGAADEGEEGWTPEEAINAKSSAASKVP